MIESELEEKRNFTVAIFGSARIQKGRHVYKQIYDLANMISEAGMNIVTGGGPGLMNAASLGHHTGSNDKNVQSIGLRISLPFQEEEASHLDIKREFSRFSNRLDSFMSFSNAVVVAPGGVGTLLEFAYTWQLLQVKHICNIPIILLGQMWTALFSWIEKWPLRHKLLDLEDVDLLFLAKDHHEAFTIINKAYKSYKKEKQVDLFKLHQIKDINGLSNQ